MTREEAKEAVKVMEAYANGKKIQYLNDNNEWVDPFNPVFDWSRRYYRIKPEQTYRPFKSQEECVKEMMNHKPFGIVTDGIRDFEFAIYPDGIFILGTSNKFYTQSFYTALKEYKFPDSTPFGVKKE